jgi:asparagine synthase (glutamine-hydrolysing)
MCGLAGIFHLDGSPIDCSNLLNMTRIIRHRGPDDEGFLLVNTNTSAIQHHVHDDTIAEIKSISKILPVSTDSNLGIGYRRLSILDISAAGHQPMSDPEGNVWIAFNGEAYNYIEVRSELIARSHQFKSNGDTEVVLHAYLEWGTECLQRFIGMFSFIIYDHRKRRLFIARDRMGVKPLNYYFDGKKFIWASEEKQIAATAIVPLSPNETKIKEFLKDNIYFEDNETFFTEIKQLQAGHFLLVDNNGLNIQKYWDLSIPPAADMYNESQSTDCILELLNDSVKLRLRSDVPLGIALSGGIDSSSVSCLARNMTQSTIQTFSVYYEGKKYDERKYIEAVLNTGGFNPTFYTANEDIRFEEISNWIYQQDAPSTGASPFSAYQNYKNVRAAGIIVLLNGQGGDELFAGYPYYLKYYLADLIKTKKWGKFLNILFHLSASQGIKTTASHTYLAGIALSKDKSTLRKMEHQKYSNREFYPETQPDIHEYYSDSFITQALYDSIKITHLPHMLRWEDRNSMANSIESRVPFLDHRLVEKSFYIPAEFKLKNGVTKFALRKAMKNTVPDLILNRTDKIGFGTPTGKWTRYFLANEIRELINDKEFDQRPWWYANKIRNRFSKDLDSFGDNELWRIMTCELWSRHFFK